MLVLGAGSLPAVHVHVQIDIDVHVNVHILDTLGTLCSVLLTREEVVMRLYLETRAFVVE